MKRKFILITMAVMTAIMTLTLVGCDTEANRVSGNIQVKFTIPIPFDIPDKKRQCIF